MNERYEVRSMAAIGNLLNSSTVTIKHVAYGSAGGGRPLFLDILLPDPVPAALMPAVIEIHGGAFLEGGPHVERNRSLAEHGFFTVSIEYRLSGEAPFPTQIYDAKAAVRWLRATAPEHHVDPERIGVRGGSAGGTLAALLGTSGDVPELEGDCGSPGYSSRVQAVVDECGATDMVEHLELTRPEDAWVIEQLFGGPLEERVELVRLANPMTHIRSGCPPFLIVHGDADDTVPIRNSELLHEALTRAGCHVTFIRVPGGGHSFVEAWDQSPDAVRLAFFERHLDAGASEEKNNHGR